MRVALTLALTLLLTVAGTAIAARGGPDKQIRPADQVRARAMLLRWADFNTAFTTRPSSPGGSGDFYCAALDESDLTLTGEARVADGDDGIRDLDLVRLRVAVGLQRLVAQAAVIYVSALSPPPGCRASAPHRARREPGREGDARRLLARQARFSWHRTCRTCPAWTRLEEP